MMPLFSRVVVGRRSAHREDIRQNVSMMPLFSRVVGKRNAHRVYVRHDAMLHCLRKVSLKFSSYKILDP